MFSNKTFLRLALVTVLASSVLMPTSFGMKGAYPGENGLIAFSAVDPQGSDREIFVMNSDGSGGHPLTHNEVNDNHPCWSPNSTQIAFVREEESIWIMNADGTGEHQVVPPLREVMRFRPAWSPDGSKLAYTYVGLGERGIYVIDVDATGSGTKLIEGAESPSWSPDGALMAYWNESDSKIWVADVTTGTPLHNVTGVGGGAPCWSPDGTQIVFSIHTLGIFVINADGTNEQQLTTADPINWHNNPNWSPDGNKILFEGEDGIWIMNADGSDAYPLTPAYSRADHPDWARGEPTESVGGEILPTTTWLPWLIPLLALLSIGAIVVIGKKTLH